MGAASSDHSDIWPERRLPTGRGRRAADRVVAHLTRWGIVPHTYVLSVRGRKTGQLHSTPVTLVERDGAKWLVAPYGPVSWVLNVRASGQATPTRRGTSTAYTAREVPVGEAAAILKDYVAVAAAARPYFSAGKDAPVEEFGREAHRHPAFALTPNGRAD